jgi:hypothetical protein
MSDTLIVNTLVNLILLIVGGILLSLAFNWQIGVGVACLIAFHKQ